MEHPLAADVGCRNTVYNAVAQSGALFLDRLRNAGVQAYRLICSVRIGRQPCGSWTITISF